jgi:hypothetical protein
MVAEMVRSVQNWTAVSRGVDTCVFSRAPLTVEGRVLGRVRHARA